MVLGGRVYVVERQRVGGDDQVVDVLPVQEHGAVAIHPSDTEIVRRSRKPWTPQGVNRDNKTGS